MKRTVVVTRPRAQAHSLIAALSRAGLRVLAAPTIRIEPPSSYKRLDAALKALDSFDGVIFASRNAVESFFARAKALRVRLERPRLLCAVGPETAKALAERGWRGAKTPKVHHGAALARALGKVNGLSLLLPRAKAGNEELPRLLRRAGAQVAVAEAYRTVAERGCAALLRKEARRGIDAVAFSSGSTVDQFVKLLGRQRTKQLFKRARAVSIGPVTSAALRRHGFKPVQAKAATAAALAQAVVRALS